MIDNHNYKRMKDESLKDASEARYLRKHRQEGGYDQDEDDEDRVFKEDVEKAIKNYSKGVATKDVQKQIQYFGYKVEPFNMRQEEELGEIDEQGFFLFNKKRQMKDAWLQSLQNNEDDKAVDKLRKKIKEEQRFQNVYDADPRENDQLKSDEQEEPEKQNEEDREQEEQEQEKDRFDGKQIKMILADLLPFGMNANQYMKSLKKQRNTQLYQKIIYLCNEYVSATGQHDIFTLKKEDLEQEQQDIQQAPLKNWDQDQQESDQNQPLNSKPQKQQNQDQDDIF